MKVLVTGASGFVGSQMVEEALSRGHAVRALVRSAATARAILKNPKVEIIEGDMTDEASLHRAVVGIGAVIHCAAATSENSRGAAWSRRVNVEGTAWLIEAARAAGPLRWIQISTMSAHESVESDYGRTKLEAEALLPPSGLAWTILRPSIIYGPGGRGLVTKTVKLLRFLPALPVVGPGTELIRPIHVGDVARAALDCLGEPATFSKVYPLGGRDEITLNEFLSKLAAASGHTRPLFHLPFWASLSLARLLGLISRNPPLTVDNVLGVKGVRRVDISDAMRDFRFDPAGLDEGLASTFAEAGDPKTERHNARS